MIEAIVLAGGKSSRMQTNKMLLTVDGTPVILHTISYLRPFVSKVIVVTGKYHKEISELLNREEKVQIVENKDYELGMFSSVKAGVRETTTDFLLTPGDCPFVSEETIEKILKGSGKIRVVRYHGEDGHPIYISKEYKEEILNFPLDSNLKVFRDSKNYEIIDVEDRNILVNLNNVLDLEKVR